MYITLVRGGGDYENSWEMHITINLTHDNSEQNNKNPIVIMLNNNNNTFTRICNGNLCVAAQGAQWKLYLTMKIVMQGERKSHRTICKADFNFN